MMTKELDGVGTPEEVTLALLAQADPELYVYTVKYPALMRALLLLDMEPPAVVEKLQKAGR